MTIESRLFIGGEFVAAASNCSFVTVNPATEEAICDVSEAGGDDVERAVCAAEAAAAAWGAIDPSERGRILFAVAKAVEHRGEELAQLDCLDAGKPILDCREDIHATVNMFRYFAGFADKFFGQTVPVQNERLCYTRREPYGVIAAITAWNYPMFNAAAKIAPILATGNACVLKPAEEAPLTALLLAKIISDVEGIPAGLLNVINGPGESTGALLANHPRIRKLTFTGSTATGRELLRASADSNMKGLTLELGGKAPVVIFDDADLEAALNAVTFSVFYNQGQTCTAATRMLVHETVLDEALKGMRERIERIAIGDPQSEETTVGPLISKVQFEKVLSYIEEGRQSGADLLCGGGRPAAFPRGYYIEPTVFLNPNSEASITRDEIFGPVLVVQSFKSDGDALELANDSSMGLAASLWTRDSKRLHTVAAQLQAGIIWCNTIFAEHPGAPAGGIKDSGFGREFGSSAADEYTWLKTVWVDLSGEHFAWV